MCNSIGVDPLACTWNGSDYCCYFCLKLPRLTAKKGFWAQMLGFGDFYYELGVQIVEVCLRYESGRDAFGLFSC